MSDGGVMDEIVDEVQVLSAVDLQRAYELMSRQPTEPEPIILSPRGAEAFRRWYLDERVEGRHG